MNLNVNNLMKKTKNFVTANSPELLVGTAIVGVITTGFLAAKAGYKAANKVRDFEEVEERETTSQEKFQLTWLTYASPALTGATTIAAVLGAHLIHTKRYAALAGFYAVAANRADDLQDQVEKHLGPKKQQEVQDAIAQKTADRDSESIDNEIVFLDGGTELCYDEFTARWFMGSHSVIEKAFLNLNLQLAKEGSASLNDFHDFLGLPPSQIGADMGWRGQDHVEPKFGSTTNKEGKPAIAFYFHENPTYDF